LAQNAQIVLIQSTLLPILAYFVIYGIFLLFARKVAGLTTNSSIIALLIFALGFNSYGFMFDFLKRVDRFPVNHEWLSPAFWSLLLYVSTQFPKIFHRVANSLSNGLVLVLSGLLLFNTGSYLTPKLAALVRQGISSTNPTPEQNQLSVGNEISRPDIYYFVLDEAIGFDQGKDFFEDPGFTFYIKELEQRGFFVARESKSRTTHTLHEIASRLNNYPYPEETKTEDLFKYISNNKLFARLKNDGYTTVVFDGVARPIFYTTKPPITADVDLRDRETAQLGYSFAFDGFSQILFNGTLLRPLAEKLTISDPELGQLREETLFILEKSKDLSDIPSPKVTYFHIMAAHRPFIFARGGKPIDPQYRNDWNYYPSSYQFLMDEMLKIVDAIKEKSSSENPPVIIIQSDHGARINDPAYAGTPDYPEEYKRSIINAIYMPGVDYAQLSDDLDPMDVFPIILQHYFGDTFE